MRVWIFLVSSLHVLVPCVSVDTLARSSSCSSPSLSDLILDSWQLAMQLSVRDVLAPAYV